MLLPAAAVEEVLIVEKELQGVKLVQQETQEVQVEEEQDHLLLMD
jgi:hypothetical protein